MKKEEAIECIRGFMGQLTEGCREALMTAIPELAESEDERIRKHLVEIVEIYWGKTNDADKAKDLAYLERKKEHSMSAEEVLTRAGLKPYKDGNKWCILAGDNIQEGICGFGDTIDEALYQFLMEVLEMQKEQKPDIEICPHSTKSKSYRENGVPIEPISDELIDIINSEFDGFRNLLKKKGIDYEPQRGYWEGVARLFDSSAREYVKKQKPVEWSEEERAKMKHEVWMKYKGEHIKALEESESRGYRKGIEDGKILAQLEWSEEDKKMLESIVNLVAGADSQLLGLRFKQFSWLKSLRPSWKPSTEQIAMVTRVCNGLHRREMLVAYEENLRTISFLDTLKEQPVCEGLETEALRSAGVLLSEHFEDEDDDAIRTTALRCWKGGVIHGASWQKEQMLKEAVPFYEILEAVPPGPERENVRIIVVKEEGKCTE